MTKLKVCAKIHLFIILSSIFIAIGLAVGTICHFCAGGFFNYGGEFSSYKCVTINYYAPCTEQEATSVCESAFGGLKWYEFSSDDESAHGNELVYKFTTSTDTAKLNAAAKKINEELNKGVSGAENINVAAVHEGKSMAGGSKAITFASIALASAAVFQFLYFILRYKLRAAFSALLASVHNLGIFVALAAVTRMPVGAEMIAFGAAVVLLTMILTMVVFDRTRKNFANERYADTERLEVIETSASEVRKLTFVSLCVLMAAIVVFGVFAAIAHMWIGALAPFGLALLSVIAVGYGIIFFTPAVHGAIDRTCEKVKKSLKNKKKGKSAKTEKPADSAKSV